MTDWAIGQTVLDGYLIEKELGRGGMGCVWLVRSNSTGHRFAVKQALLKEETHRKAFLAELQTWIDLPEHPNIVPCRFFSTVGDEVLIFAEGGSLKDWIDTKKLYEGGPQKAVERILDAERVPENAGMSRSNHGLSFLVINGGCIQPKEKQPISRRFAGKK